MSARAAETHAKGLQAWRSNAPDEAENLMLQSSGMALTIRILFDLADFYTSHAKWELAEEQWQKFEAHRGNVIVHGWFPGILVLGWLYRAIAAEGRSDREVAFRSSRKVLDHWERFNPQLEVVRIAERINFQSK
jgi:hypothetical protein